MAQEVHMVHTPPKSGQPTAKGATPLQSANAPFSDTVTRQIWLQYFNNYLRDRNIITEGEWRKMRRLIEKD